TTRPGRVAVNGVVPIEGRAAGVVNAATVATGNVEVEEVVLYGRGLCLAVRHVEAGTRGSRVAVHAVAVKHRRTVAAVDAAALPGRVLVNVIVMERRLCALNTDCATVASHGPIDHLEVLNHWFNARSNVDSPAETQRIEYTVALMLGESAIPATLNGDVLGDVDAGTNNAGIRTDAAGTAIFAGPTTNTGNKNRVPIHSVLQG